MLATQSSARSDLTLSALVVGTLESDEVFDELLQGFLAKNLSNEQKRIFFDAANQRIRLMLDTGCQKENIDWFLALTEIPEIQSRLQDLWSDIERTRKNAVHSRENDPAY